MANVDKFVSTREAAKIAGMTESAIRQMCNAEPQQIRSKKIGGRWVVLRSEAERVRDTPAPTGRPRTNPGGAGGKRDGSA
jgi:hypothetical protein